MPKKKYERGKIITYDHVPTDVYDLILDKQLEIKKRTQRGQVSLSEAITALIRGK